MVVALAGRRIDAEDASSPRFPTENIEKIKEKIGLFFIEKKPDWLVSSGACGADLIALDVAGELQINRKMILPFHAETFRSTSVTDRAGDWGNLFDRIYGELKNENNVIDLDYDKDGDDVYEKANFDILNEADKIYSELKNDNSQSGVGNKKMAMIIWEGKPKNSDDTTDHFRQEAIKRGYEILEINCLHP